MDGDTGARTKSRGDVYVPEVTRDHREDPGSNTMHGDNEEVASPIDLKPRGHADPQNKSGRSTADVECRRKPHKGVVDGGRDRGDGTTDGTSGDLQRVKLKLLETVESSQDLEQGDNVSTNLVTPPELFDQPAERPTEPPSTKLRLEGVMRIVASHEAHWHDDIAFRNLSICQLLRSGLMLVVCL